MYIYPQVFEFTITKWLRVNRNEYSKSKQIKYSLNHNNLLILNMKHQNCGSSVSFLLSFKSLWVSLESQQTRQPTQSPKSPMSPNVDDLCCQRKERCTFVSSLYLHLLLTHCYSRLILRRQWRTLQEQRDR